jgi:Asp-tRNA(Asn)/Glu-tRNA(Gln) amidotransferase A subunit family amidase
MLAYEKQFDSIGQVQKAIEDGTTTVEAIVQQYLRAIEALNPKINAVTVVNANALEDAKALDVGSILLNGDYQR